MRRGACLIYVQTVALAICLVLVCLLFTGPTQGERMSLEALSHMGAPYVFGKDGPDQFDCSGLILYCARLEGLPELPHEAKQLYGLGLPVARWQLLPGDMVCFDTVRDSDPCDHVGFYLGGNRFVHASSGKHEVTVSELTDYYADKYTGARRLGCGFI